MQQPTVTPPPSQKNPAHLIREAMPHDGLFAGHEWRVSPAPFPLGKTLADEIESLGRVLLQFYHAVNLLYRKSVEGKQPAWVAQWLDQGKPDHLIQLQRASVFKNDVPRVIRPDLLITDQGLAVTELDSVPGGIGLTAWLNQTYSKLDTPVIGGADGMLRGFASIFGDASNVHLVISEEAATYRPEMSWMAEQIDPARFKARDSNFMGFSKDDAVYRFFELFDLPNVSNSQKIFDLALSGEIRLTPPPKPIFEEKMLFALLWNRNLQEFWRQELGQGFFDRMLRMVPFTWLIDPTPLPPHGGIPHLNLTDWRQLKTFSQKERELILKISGFSPKAWGARGVYLGNDLSQAEWSEQIEHALAAFSTSPSVLQKFHKPNLVAAQWFDFASSQVVPMNGRVRLCPYYFVSGDIQNARANLGGILATICPPDKKIIHGMTDAIFAPCGI
jgi:hypothetical protein